MTFVLNHIHQKFRKVRSSIAMYLYLADTEIE